MRLSTRSRLILLRKLRAGEPGIVRRIDGLAKLIPRHTHIVGGALLVPFLDQHVLQLAFAWSVFLFFLHYIRCGMNSFSWTN